MINHIQVYFDIAFVINFHELRECLELESCWKQNSFELYWGSIVDSFSNHISIGLL